MTKYFIIGLLGLFRCYSALAEPISVKSSERGGLFLGLFAITYEANKIAGYTVKPIIEDTILRGTGLEPGDLIKKINNIEINESLSYQGLLTVIKESSSLKFYVERKGIFTPFYIDYEISVIDEPHVQ